MPAQTGRPLTPGEIDLTRSVFGDAIDCSRVTLRQRKWIFFQPRNTVMAPLGHIHFHPAGPNYRDDFAASDLSDQGLFIHEMTHVWQHQQGIFLPIARHPFCRYGYLLQPGRGFQSYGIEQQAEIVRHGFMLSRNPAWPAPGAPEDYRNILPFGTQTA